MVQGEGRLQWKDGAGHRALGHQVDGQQPLLQRGRRPWDGHGMAMGDGEHGEGPDSLQKMRNSGSW